MAKRRSAKSGNSRSSRKAAQNQPPESLIHVFENDWTDDWIEIADQLCDLLEIPDLSTRSGLKQTHVKLDSIHKRLDDTLKFARSTGRTCIVTGVVAIYSKMCSLDAVLQEKLLSHGLYATLVSLATQDDTREIALRVLGSIACRSGASEKLSSHFLKGSPTLLDLAVKHSDDALTMSLLSHVFAHTSVDQEQLQRKIDIALLGRTLLKAIRRPDTLPDTYRHVFGCFAFDSYEMWMQRKNLPGFTTLQVALLQSEQLDVRAGAMSIIVKILATPQAEDPSVLKGHGARPRATLACEDGCIKSARIARDLDIDSLPPKLLERLDEYTGESIEIAEIQEARASYTGFSLRHAKKEDLRPLGRDLAYMIYSYRYALPDLLHPADGSVESCYKCHTEQTWPELLRKCANQLYDRTPRQREDIFSADILSWKIRTQECTAKCLFDCCKEFRARHPDVALFYYLPNPDRSGLYAEDFLRMAKKGLMCTDTPEWLRFELLWQASQAAYFAGIQKAIDPHSEDDNGLLFLAAARTDAKKFLDESPPDGLRRASALALYMCATLVLEGPKCDFNDPYIKRVLEDIEVNKQLRKHMNYPIPKEHEATMFPHETIRKLTPGAMKEWGDVVRHMETLLAERNVQQCSEEDVDDALTRWVNTFETDETEEARETRKARMAVVHTGSGKIALKLCMWCGGPSAALKKCGGCSNAWYCDTQCQKMHWKKHKSDCRSSDEKTAEDDEDS